ncbi:hypothetical protein FA13DRAFT_1873046 [Coprinellus micaceus]|uniref:JmjC domain-containing protein n=1 Tax=Coprinellus micaceus TaxID=71717 RepID=A0A4Y7T3Z5_COPMI|nr:hypothetical protein FA13DRAFT_1873046 [Coprinellus micaceus]
MSCPLLTTLLGSAVSETLLACFNGSMSFCAPFRGVRGHYGDISTGASPTNNFQLGPTGKTIRRRESGRRCGGIGFRTTERRQGGGWDFLLPRTSKARTLMVACLPLPQDSEPGPFQVRLFQKETLGSCMWTLSAHNSTLCLSIPFDVHPSHEFSSYYRHPSRSKVADPEFPDVFALAFYKELEELYTYTSPDIGPSPTKYGAQHPHVSLERLGLLLGRSTPASPDPASLLPIHNDIPREFLAASPLIVFATPGAVLKEFADGSNQERNVDDVADILFSYDSLLIQQGPRPYSFLCLNGLTVCMLMWHGDEYITDYEGPGLSRLDRGNQVFPVYLI